MKELNKNEIYSLEGLSDEQLEVLAEKTDLLSCLNEYKRAKYIRFWDNWCFGSNICKTTAKAIDLFTEETNIINKQKTDKILPRMTEEKDKQLFGITTDKVVQSVMNDLNERSRIGVKKYNTTLERTDIELLGWLKHLREELMDAVLYIKRAEIEIENKK